MRSVSLWEAYPVVLCKLETAARLRIGHDLSARHAVGIELVVPCRIERIGPVDPLAVTTDLDHLRATGIRLAVGMGGTTSNPADVDRVRKLRFPGIGNVILAHFAGSPAGDIKKPIIHGKVNIG